MKKRYLLSGFILFLLSCSSRNITIHDEWGKYFTIHKVQGCFMLFDNGHTHIDMYNRERATQQFLPAASFTIMNSLIGLETGIIRDTNMVITTDSAGNVQWNRKLTMAQAFRTSVAPFFQEVARRIGPAVMQLWIDSVKYGNMKISNHIDSFWLDNSLKISPDEQLGFVKKLYFNNLPFHDRAQRLVSNIMLMKKTPQYKLSYKTGQGLVNGQLISWMAGWEEENNHPYFFVLNIESADSSANMPSIQNDIFRAIMTEQGFFKGKK